MTLASLRLELHYVRLMRSRNFTSLRRALFLRDKYSFHFAMGDGGDFHYRVTRDVLAQPLRGVKELLMASLMPAADSTME